MGLLTNESSMVALNTLRMINKDLSMVQSEISTGKSISNARDNAAIWAVSTVMQSDVDGFEAISSSLDLGASTVGVARGGAEKITELLQEMKALIVNAQEENVDRTKIQTDIDQIENTITQIVDGAQFNGLNLLKGTDPVNILSSLNRASDGTVSTSTVQIARNDLSITGGTALPVTGATAVGGATIAAGGSQTYTVSGTITAGETYTATVGGTDFTYVAASGDGVAEVAAGLASAVGTNVTDVTATTAAGVITFNNAGAAGVSLATAAVGAASSSQLAAVAAIDVTTNAGASSALNTIEGLIQTGIDAAAGFGSAQKRIDIQNEFVRTLTDSLKTGIGALVEADLEEASARLQSLQVQQQLGVQALSIANQRPQVLLGLFR